MDTRTGRIYDSEQMAEIAEYLSGSKKHKPEFFKTIPRDEQPENMEDLKPMKVPPTEGQLKTRKIGRNEPCPCGSGIKFKKCCRQ